MRWRKGGWRGGSAGIHLAGLSCLGAAVLLVPSAAIGQVPAPGAVDLSAFAAVELPAGRLADRVDAGFGPGGDVALNLPFGGISLVGSLIYVFASGAEGAPGAHLLHYSAALEKDFTRIGPLRPVGVFADTGLGGFRFDPDEGPPTTDLALHVGVGLELRRGPAVGLRFELRDYVIFSEPETLDALTLTAGIRIL